MNFVPEIDIEYVLLRFFRGRTHIVTYNRYADDSGSLKHGHSLHRWEFNPTAWSETWKRLRSAGWQHLDDAIKAGLADPNALPNCTNCDCQIPFPKITEFIDDRSRRGTPIDQINREWLEYATLFDESQEELLWGDGKVG